MRGLPIGIYKEAGRTSSNGGVSEFHDRALVIGAGIPEIFDDAGLPVLVLMPGNLPGCAKLVPAFTGGKWTMFGGAFGYTSDSRFHEAVERIIGCRSYGAVPIHDRIEE